VKLPDAPLVLPTFAISAPLREMLFYGTALPVDQPPQTVRFVLFSSDALAVFEQALGKADH
jgi:hypothetical protein